ncbi:MAG: hypothetical protein IPI57_15035 [Candidatus Competibacteraceae bacterium]|nr:hypothetical protein [Candidatus Competibacteraceae bacterium]
MTPPPVNPIPREDNNQYWCGTPTEPGEWSTHKVLLTSLVKMGNNVAAATGGTPVRSFPSVEYVLMVGIAGAYPIRKTPKTTYGLETW